jgi:hypothetical protein
MEKYNYLESVKEDVRNWLENDGENFKDSYADENGEWLREDNRDEVEEDLHDTLWTVDSVTGNASGSYTFNTWQAEENLCHNHDLLEEACKEFGSDVFKLGAEACDVAIRSYLLNKAISEVLDEMQEA